MSPGDIFRCRNKCTLCTLAIPVCDFREGIAYFRWFLFTGTNIRNSIYRLWLWCNFKHHVGLNSAKENLLRNYYPIFANQKSLKSLKRKFIGEVRFLITILIPFLRMFTVSLHDSDLDSGDSMIWMLAQING